MEPTDGDDIRTDAALDELKRERVILDAVLKGEVVPRTDINVNPARLAELDARIAGIEMGRTVRASVERVRVLCDGLRLPRVDMRNVDRAMVAAPTALDESRAVRAVLRAEQTYRAILDATRRASGLARDALDEALEEAAKGARLASLRTVKMPDTLLVMRRICGEDAVSKRTLQRWIEDGKAANVGLPVGDADLSSLSA